MSYGPTSASPMDAVVMRYERCLSIGLNSAFASMSLSPEPNRRSCRSPRCEPCTLHSSMISVGSKSVNISICFKWSSRVVIERNKSGVTVKSKSSPLRSLSIIDYHFISVLLDLRQNRLREQ